MATIKEAREALEESMEALEAAYWALLACADQASDLAETRLEVIDLWNEGGEAYEAVQKVKAALEKLAEVQK